MKSAYVSPEFELEKFKITQDLLAESGDPSGTSEPEEIDKGEIEL